MRVRLIAAELWTLYGVMDGQHDVLRDLEVLERQFGANVRGLLRLLEEIACGRRDPTQLPKELCHRIDDSHQIWQFTKGRLRLLWFYDGVKLIVCVHVFIKKSQETPKKERDIAISLKTRYEKAVSDGTLEVIENEDE